MLRITARGCDAEHALLRPSRLHVVMPCIALVASVLALLLFWLRAARLFRSDPRSDHRYRVGPRHQAAPAPSAIRRPLADDLIDGARLRLRAAASSRTWATTRSAASSSAIWCTTSASGDFVVNLIRESQDLNEYAFALGALAHYAADTQGHSVAVNRVGAHRISQAGKEIRQGGDL